MALRIAEYSWGFQLKSGISIIMSSSAPTKRTSRILSFEDLGSGQFCDLPITFKETGGNKLSPRHIRSTRYPEWRYIRPGLSISDINVNFRRAPRGDWDAEFGQEGSEWSGGHWKSRAPNHHHAVLDNLWVSTSVVADSEDIPWVAYWHALPTPSYLPNHEISAG